MSTLKKAFTIIILLSTSFVAGAQDMGVSFSFFFPKNGDFSTPISPFSIRGLGVNLTNFLGLQTGFSLYRMTGMNITDIPLESTKPLVGPNFTLLIPAEAVIQLGNESVQFSIKGGGFFFYSFDQKLNYGNIDRAIRTQYNLAVVNSEFGFDNKPGFGYLFGSELIVYLANGYGVSLEGNYYIGGSNLNLTGNYLGFDSTGNAAALDNNGNPTSVALDYSDSKVDFTGLEVSVGIIMSGGGGGPKRGKKRRRR